MDLKKTALKTEVLLLNVSRPLFSSFYEICIDFYFLNILIKRKMTKNVTLSE